AKRVGPWGQVHAFEPQRHIYRHLITNIVLNDLETIVDVYPAAIGNYTGTIDVPVFNYSQPGNFGSLTLTERYPTQTPELTYQVQIHRLDELDFYNP
ncbi:FkbM family methyltransferase, partial [Klebsiella pneumoniae]|uniref:FkbM family methyltransferase n=1 Tax=Klebsiella pneumoniae TaxID=573 RepID=UPI003EE30DAC